MKKIITIQVQKEVEINYVVPTSNTSGGYYKPGQRKANEYDMTTEAFLIGLPCKVVSEPYKALHNYAGMGTRSEEVIDVVSCLTGIKYTIPTDWCKEFESFDETVEDSAIRSRDGLVMVFANENNIIGRPYYPKDNSFIMQFGDDKYARHPLYGKECKCISLPFVEEVECAGDKYTYKFVLVEYEGKVYRTLFEEWCFYPNN